ncbi:MAG TPA: ComEA family DNA-binding protein [Patescibacteria group bacterium]|nr:ComEA family DNA-binding protein [Patescibacteria group bacterium]
MLERMDGSALIEKLKLHWLPISLGVIGFVFLLYGLIYIVIPKEKKGEITFEAASDVSPLAKEAEQKRLIVDVSGAVEKPGVYDLPADARVQDALIAAGGMSSQADREAVAKNFNLAAKLTDGGKIYVPAIGDPSTSLHLGFEGQAVAGVNVSGLININTASASDLDTLSGVGPATSEKIINNRPYSSIEELVSKKVVGQKVFEDIKEKVSVY